MCLPLTFRSPPPTSRPWGASCTHTSYLTLPLPKPTPHQQAWPESPPLRHPVAAASPRAAAVITFVSPSGHGRGRPGSLPPHAPEAVAAGGREYGWRNARAMTPRRRLPGAAAGAFWACSFLACAWPPPVSAYSIGGMFDGHGSALLAPNHHIFQGLTRCCFKAFFKALP